MIDESHGGSLYAYNSPRQLDFEQYLKERIGANRRQEGGNKNNCPSLGFKKLEQNNDQKKRRDEKS